MSGYIGTQPVPQATQTRDSFTATSGQTSFATGGYTPNFLDVYLNGVKLSAADYTASNGSDVVLASGAATGDILEVVAFTTFTPASIPVGTPSIDDNGNATAITIDSSENVGIGTTTPSGKLELYGSGISDLPLVINHAWGSSSTALISASAASSEVFKVERNGDLTLSGGVYLGGTGSANKLDDYEEGTFSPIISGGTSAGTVTYNTRIGQYTKVGNLVTVWMNINWSSGNGSGSLMVKGLPFSVINTARPVFNVISENVSLASNQLAAGFSNFSDGIIMVRNITGTGATLTLTYDSAGTLFLTGTYPTND